MPNNENSIPNDLVAADIHAAASMLDMGYRQAFHDSTKFDVLIDGNTYPPKAILAAAIKHAKNIDLMPGEFTGGLDSKCHRVLQNLGFTIVAKSQIMQPHRFQIGHLYNRKKDIHESFGDQQQSGIVTPLSCPFIFLFTSESGEKHGYRDGPDGNGVFLYTGEGQVGDHKFVRGNKAIRDHVKNGKTLELFRSLGKQNDCCYLGTFFCSSWEEVDRIDGDGKPRKLIVFHLATNQPEAEEDALNQTQSLNLEQLRERAYDAAKTIAIERSIALRTAYSRSSLVKAYVLRRANGVCELCELPAPFLRRDSTPYLEPHHTRRVSDDGPDHPRWVAAVCPNCHREIHSGLEGEQKNQELMKKLALIEQDVLPRKKAIAEPTVHEHVPVPRQIT